MDLSLLSIVNLIAENSVERVGCSLARSTLGGSSTLVASIHRRLWRPAFVVELLTCRGGKEFMLARAG